MHTFIYFHQTLLSQKKSSNWKFKKNNDYLVFQNVTIQCLLITDGQSTFTVFNYIDFDLQVIGNRNITIGYQYGSVFEKNPFSYKNAAFKMSTIPGNRGIIFTCYWWAIKLNLKRVIETTMYLSIKIFFTIEYFCLIFTLLIIIRKWHGV